VSSYIGAEQGRRLRRQVEKRRVTAHQLRGAANVTAFLTSYIGAEQGRRLRRQVEKRRVTAHQLRGAASVSAGTEGRPVQKSIGSNVRIRAPRS
jgi:hypothetical protein